MSDRLFTSSTLTTVSESSACVSDAARIPEPDFPWEVPAICWVMQNRAVNAVAKAGDTCAVYTRLYQGMTTPSRSYEYNNEEEKSRINETERDVMLARR